MSNRTACTFAVFVTDVTVMELEVRGESLPFCVEFEPPALILQSAAFAGVTTKRQVTVCLSPPLCSSLLQTITRVYRVM